MEDPPPIDPRVANMTITQIKDYLYAIDKTIVIPNKIKLQALGIFATDILKNIPLDERPQSFEPKPRRATTPRLSDISPAVKKILSSSLSFEDHVRIGGKQFSKTPTKNTTMKRSVRKVSASKTRLIPAVKSRRAPSPQHVHDEENSESELSEISSSGESAIKSIVDKPTKSPKSSAKASKKTKSVTFQPPEDLVTKPKAPRSRLSKTGDRVTCEPENPGPTSSTPNSLVSKPKASRPCTSETGQTVTAKRDNSAPKPTASRPRSSKSGQTVTAEPDNPASINRTPAGDLPPPNSLGSKPTASRSQSSKAGKTATDEPENPASIKHPYKDLIDCSNKPIVQEARNYKPLIDLVGNEASLSHAPPPNSTLSNLATLVWPPPKPVVPASNFSRLLSSLPVHSRCLLTDPAGQTVDTAPGHLPLSVPLIDLNTLLTSQPHHSPAITSKKTMPTSVPQRAGTPDHGLETRSVISKDSPSKKSKPNTLTVSCASPTFISSILDEWVPDDQLSLKQLEHRRLQQQSQHSKQDEFSSAVEKARLQLKDQQLRLSCSRLSQPNPVAKPLANIDPALLAIDQATAKPIAQRMTKPSARCEGKSETTDLLTNPASIGTVPAVLPPQPSEGKLFYFPKHTDNQSAPNIYITGNPSPITREPLVMSPCHLVTSAKTNILDSSKSPNNFYQSVIPPTDYNKPLVAHQGRLSTLIMPEPLINPPCPPVSSMECSALHLPQATATTQKVIVQETNSDAAPKAFNVSNRAKAQPNSDAAPRAFNVSNGAKAQLTPASESDDNPAANTGQTATESTSRQSSTELAARSLPRRVPHMIFGSHAINVVNGGKAQPNLFDLCIPLGSQSSKQGMLTTDSDPAVTSSPVDSPCPQVQSKQPRPLELQAQIQAINSNVFTKPLNMANGGEAGLAPFNSNITGLSPSDSNIPPIIRAIRPIPHDCSKSKKPDPPVLPPEASSLKATSLPKQVTGLSMKKIENYLTDTPEPLMKDPAHKSLDTKETAVTSIPKKPVDLQVPSMQPLLDLSKMATTDQEELQATIATKALMVANPMLPNKNSLSTTTQPLINFPCSSGSGEPGSSLLSPEPDTIDPASTSLASKETVVLIIPEKTVDLPVPSMQPSSNLSKVANTDQGEIQANNTKPLDVADEGEARLAPLDSTLPPIILPVLPVPPETTLLSLPKPSNDTDQSANNIEPLNVADEGKARLAPVDSTLILPILPVQPRTTLPCSPKHAAHDTDQSVPIEKTGSTVSIQEQSHLDNPTQSDMEITSNTAATPSHVINVPSDLAPVGFNPTTNILAVPEPCDLLDKLTPVNGLSGISDLSKELINKPLFLMPQPLVISDSSTADNPNFPSASYVDDPLSQLSSQDFQSALPSPCESLSVTPRGLPSATPFESASATPATNDLAVTMLKPIDVDSLSHALEML